MNMVAAVPIGFGYGYELLQRIGLVSVLVVLQLCIIYVTWVLVRRIWRKLWDLG